MEKFLVPIYILVLFVFIIFWIWALLDLAFATFHKTKWKLAWLLIIVCFPIFGSILYLLLRNEFKAERRRDFNPGFRAEDRI